jgi:rare lipoprotein A
VQRHPRSYAVRDAREPIVRGAVLWLAVVALLGVPNGNPRADTAVGVKAFATAVERGIGAVQVGLVSWYGAAFHDRPTASGEKFDSGDMTMAHPTLPFGTQVKVTNLRNGRSVVVRVNDRGPHVGQRIADLSRAAATQLGMLKRGVVRARIEVLDAAGLDVEATDDEDAVAGN